MKLSRLILQNFRCFGSVPVAVDFSDLTAFVGANGTGKTAVLMALVRMFGMVQSQRQLTKDDFHQAADGSSSDTLTLMLEAIFEFPELMDDAQAARSSAVPECLRAILAEDADGVPKCRIRLHASWKKSATAEGEIDQRLEWTKTLAAEVPEEQIFPLYPRERSLIQVLFVPAARDATRDLRQSSGTVISRVLQRINWPDDIRAKVLSLSKDMSLVLRQEKAVTELENSLQHAWGALRGAGGGKPELSVAETDLATLLRRLDTQIVAPSGTPQPSTFLSEGERSLMYFALVSSALKYEAEHPADDKERPVLTILAVEEPENHLAPHYLSRILASLRGIQKQQNGQVALSSHSASILRRVDPTEVRHFRIGTNGRHRVAPVTLPKNVDEANKYVRQAVQAHPEIYFARAVVLCEGASEEVVLPLVATYMDLDIDPRFVAVVPLGGRHVHYFWKLLADLGTPHVTLLDLDMEREGGGWGRVHEVCSELLHLGHPATEVFRGIPADEAAKMPDWTPEPLAGNNLSSWLEHLCMNYHVYFSGQLDFDLALLEAFPDAYKTLAPGQRGPQIPTSEPARTERTERAVVAVLGDGGGNGMTYAAPVKELFPWYSYLFIARSKPVTHARVLASVDKATVLAKCPAVIKNVIQYVKIAVPLL